jgi:hypothetical protein
MRRVLALTVCFLALAGLGSAAAAGRRKLVEGTVYDATCATATCEPECPPPPHCGPITARRDARIVCPLTDKRIVACPLSATVDPIYSGEGAVVKVRRRGASKVLATLPVTEGRFKVHLGAGEYVFHAFLPEPECWTSEAQALDVSSRAHGPVAAALDATDSCVAHLDTAP